MYMYFTYKGLHFLIDPVAEDVKVVCHLLTYLENVKDKSDLHNNDEFLVATLNFLQGMEQYYGATRAHSVSNWMLFLRQLLAIISDTVFIKLSCTVCEVAVETAVTVPCRIRTNLNNLGLRLNNICSVVRLCKEKPQKSVIAKEEAPKTVTILLHCGMKIWWL